MGWLLRSRYQRATSGKGARAQAIGRSRGGLTTKTHAVVDALGNPIRLKLTGGQVHDSRQALKLIEGLAAEHAIARPIMPTPL